MNLKSLFIGIGLVVLALFVIFSWGCQKTQPTAPQDISGKTRACGTCSWYGTNYPVCCNTNNGWGWEDQASCIGCQVCLDAGQNCTNCTQCGGGGTTTTTSGGTTTTTSGGTTTTSGGGGNTIVVRARGVAGSEHINLTVGGSQIGDFNLSTSMSNYSASTNNTGDINVCFDNDDGDRDVQVDYITVNGSTRQAEDQSSNTGVWQNSSCGGEYSEWLHCNGCIGFGSVSGGGGTTTTTSATTTTTSGSSWWGGGWW